GTLHRGQARGHVDVRRRGALVLARGPAGRRAGDRTDVLARRVLRIERRRVLVARDLGLGDGGELGRIGDLELERIEGGAGGGLLEVDRQPVLAGVAAADRVEPDAVLALGAPDSGLSRPALAAL